MKPTKIKKSCLICNREFYTYPKRIQKGQGKFCSSKCYYQYAKGKNNPIWKQKIERICLICSKKLFITPALKNRTKFCSIKCYGEWQSQNKKGKNNSNWKGGYNIRYKSNTATTKYKEWRLRIFNRDNFTCQLCKKSDKIIQAHHILPVKNYLLLLFEVWNGITLCCKCHRKTFKKENKYREYFLSLTHKNICQQQIIY